MLAKADYSLGVTRFEYRVANSGITLFLSRLFFCGGFATVLG